MKIAKSKSKPAALTLNRETVARLHVRSGVQTGKPIVISGGETCVTCLQSIYCMSVGH